MKPVAKQVIVPFVDEPVYGVTYKGRWFHYCYRDQKTAEFIANGGDKGHWTKGELEVNFPHLDRPYRLSFFESK